MRLVGAALLALTAAAASAQNAPLVLQPGETLLEVAAEGVHLDRPDLMTITAGVVTTGASAGAALRQNSILANRLIEVVRSRNIAARDIRTTELRIRPVFAPLGRNQDAEEGTRRIVGYTATNHVELRLRDLVRAPELLDALLQAGANDVDGPSFSLTDDRPAVLAARREAVRLAREQAEAYAGALGMRVARILRVSERNRQFGEGNQIVVTGSRIQPGPPIEPGEISTRIEIWVDFTLVPQ